MFQELQNENLALRRQLSHSTALTSRLKLRLDALQHSVNQLLSAAASDSTEQRSRDDILSDIQRHLSESLGMTSSLNVSLRREYLSSLPPFTYRFLPPFLSAVDGLSRPRQLHVVFISSLRRLRPAWLDRHSCSCVVVGRDLSASTATLECSWSTALRQPLHVLSPSSRRSLDGALSYTNSSPLDRLASSTDRINSTCCVNSKKKLCDVT